MALVSAGYVQIADLSAAIGLPAIPPGTMWAVVQAEGQAIRWRDDGTNPTATVGMLLAVGVAMTFETNLNNLKMIQAAGGAKANVTYYHD
jgi:hypothetical protein